MLPENLWPHKWFSPGEIDEGDYGDEHLYVGWPRHSNRMLLRVTPALGRWSAHRNSGP